MYRLRDLDGRARPVAFAVFVLLAIPFALSLHRAADVGWIPSGDDAMIGMRAHGILDGHLPLVGQPSTSHLYGPDEGTAHPGPIEFYWLAGPVRLLGPTAGMLAATALVNLASVLAAAWIVLRRAGPGVALWASVLLAGVLWSEGTALLSDPISSNMGGLPLLALGAAAWAVVDGDHRLLPLATVVGSWVAQQHLAIVAPAAALVAWVLVGLVAPDVARVWTRWRSGEPAEAAGPGGGARGSRQPADGAPSSRGERRWPWLAASVVIAAVLWAPVAWQQLTGDRGNVSAVVDYARTSESPQLTAADAVRQGVRAMGYPPLLVRSDLNGFDLYPGPLRPVEIVVAALGYGALGATVVVWFRRRRTLSLLAATALVLAAGGVVNGSSVPASIEAYRINFYRWTFVVAWLGWTAIGWAAARLALAAAAGRGVRRWALPARRVLGGAAVVAMVAATLVNGFTAGVDDRRRDQEGFGAMRAVAAVAVDEAEGHDRVTLVVRGRSAVLASGSMLMLQLAAAGHDARVRSAGTWGGRQSVSAYTMRASAAIGVDLSDHRSRQLTAELIATDGADLIVAMTRQHLREVVALDHAAWPRTFTLKDLARRAVAVPSDVGGLEAWREALGTGRRAADLMTPSPDDDIDDPYGGPFATHGLMVAEVDALIADVVRRLPSTGD